MYTLIAKRRIFSRKVCVKRKRRKVSMKICLLDIFTLNVVVTFEGIQKSNVRYILEKASRSSRHFIDLFYISILQGIITF